MASAGRQGEALMIGSSSDGREGSRARLAPRGTVQGYLALLILTATFAFALLRERIPEPLYLLILWTLLVAGLLLSFDGVRYGQAGGRVAAWFSLIVFSMMALLAILGALNSGF
jgi:hypothetical protein